MFGRSEYFLDGGRERWRRVRRDGC